jgi:hypothetical protein
MPNALLLIAFYFSQLLSMGSSLATFAWPLVVITVALLIVFSPWGRGIVKITTKFGALERQVADTAQRTEHVARYSISDYIFYLLVNLDQAQKANGEYLYRNDGTMWRNLRFLMDHGYVEEPADRTNLRGIVKITPAGYALIALRAQGAQASVA